MDQTGDVSWATEGSLAFEGPVFSVTSGPCTVSEVGRCVGRPQGYGPSEECTITVRGGGVLAACAVFDTATDDFVTMPRWQPHGEGGYDHTMPGGRYEHPNCPAGWLALVPI